MSAVPKQPEQAEGTADLRRVDLSATVTVSKAAHYRSEEWGNHQLAIQALIDWVSELHVGDKSNGEVWAPATLTGPRRLANRVEGVNLAVFDSDAGHTLADLRDQFERLGWYARIIPSSSWGKTETEASADHYDAWRARQPDPSAPDLPERYLVEVLRKTPQVAAGAAVINRVRVPIPTKQGPKRYKHLIRFKHNPCEKYRIVCVLSEPFNLSTKEARQAWKKHYDAMIDVIGLPLDHSTGSPERLFYLSYLSPDRLERARDHQAEVEGGYIDVAALPAPKPRERARRGRVGTGRVRDQDGGDNDGGFIWTDPKTGRVMNLEVLAAKGVFQHLELADVLQDNGWPPDDRGENDGKHHIQCPFGHEHTDQNDGATYCWNASDYERVGMTDLQPGAGINCLHNSCQGRDRLEQLLELLHKGDEGGLKTADLERALDAARYAQAADEFDVIEDPDSIDLRPLIKPEMTWTLDTIKAHASPLRRLRKEDPDKYEQARFYWDFTDTIDHTELDRLCDEAPDDLPPKFGDPAGGGEDPIARAIDYMNRRHFVTSVKGKARVVTPREEQEIDEQTRQVTYDFGSFPDITHLYANKKVWIETKQGPKQIPIAPLWLNHTDRRTYLGGMVFKPKGKVPPDCYNTWEGFGVEPAAGDWSKLRWHMLNIICRGNEGYFDWLLKWCAHMVQRPMIKSQVAVVMKGGEGCGKGTLGHVLRRIAGPHGFYVSSQRGVIGNFNAHLADRLLLFADEAFYAGDKQHEGVLKALVTESKIMIERKGIDPIQQESYLRIVMATNNDWAVPAGVDARRWFVLDVPKTKTGDEAYFKALNAEIDNGGLAAFLHDLLHLDLAGWNYAKAPQTAGLMDQKLRSLQGVPRWWLGRLDAAEEDEQEIETGRLLVDDEEDELVDAVNPLSDDGGPVQPKQHAELPVWRRRLYKADLYEEYTDWFRFRKAAEYQLVERAIFWKEIRKLAPGMTKTRPQPKKPPQPGEPERPEMVHLPPLAESRADFEKFMGGEIPWKAGFDDEA